MKMTNENKLTFEMVLTIFGVCVIFGWTLYSLYELSLFLAVLFCVMSVVIAMACILYSYSTKDTEVLERNICKRLKRNGFHFEKKEETLYVTKNNSHFQVQLADSYNRRIKHLYVFYKFRDDDFGKVNMDGWSRAANAININNTDTVFVALEDHLCCCYQTSIGNSKDFMNEFGRAYQAIGEAMEDYGKLIPYLERDYPSHKENKTGIGFKQSGQ